MFGPLCGCYNFDIPWDIFDNLILVFDCDTYFLFIWMNLRGKKQHYQHLIQYENFFTVKYIWANFWSDPSHAQRQRDFHIKKTWIRPVVYRNRDEVHYIYPKGQGFNTPNSNHIRKSKVPKSLPKSPYNMEPCMGRAIFNPIVDYKKVIFNTYIKNWNQNYFFLERSNL